MKQLILLLTFWVGLLTYPDVIAQTTFGEGAGEYQELFDQLKNRLAASRLTRKVTLGGKERQQFVPWIRDNTHVVKAMKYFHPDISSFWELFMERQTEEGLYYDYYFRIEASQNHRMNLFDHRYWEIYSGEGIQMHRLPVEADLEYLVVEGAWYIWQAGGDNEYIRQWMEGLEKGLYYSMGDPLRWSKKYQLVKRGYTLDTWDFMQLPATREEYTKAGGDVQEGIFDIDENTPMGIMHGDNSGLFAACNQLSKMYESLGEPEKAKIWANQAEIIRLRTNQLCWNGKYYAHFVPDDPMPDYLKIDQKNTLSLSNPYDINRGLPTHDMAVSIIKTYQSLKEKNKLNSFAEWFGIYPPVEPHFADYEPGSYMNGGVNTIVGGELAKAAFQQGMENYGADILLRMLELVRKHDGDLPVAYKPDGTVDRGIPDNWGQAAVMSALIEGLAGVVDLGQLFNSVELSPRWLAAGKNDVEITIEYPASEKQVHYHYLQNADNNQLQLTVSGDPQYYRVRMLLPEGRKASKTTVDNKSVSFQTEKIESSVYVVVDKIPAGEHVIMVQYR
jgi:hypothetical protein